LLIDVAGCLLFCNQVRAAELSSEAQDSLRAATQEAILAMPELRGMRWPVIPLQVTPIPGVQLLFSDMPEYVHQSNGVTMMQDVSAGTYRLYVYHVPGSNGVPKTISALIENRGNEPMTVQFIRSGFPAPGTDYAAMGVAGLMEFFTNKTVLPALSIAPHARAVLDHRLDGTIAADPVLVHALYEFRINQPARIAVFQRDTNQVSENIFDSLPDLPRQLPGRKLSGAGRGIFPTADLAAVNQPGTVIDSAAGVQRLVLADGRLDPWVKGVDGLAGNMEVTNKGSYGVVYHVRLACTSSDGRSWALLVAAGGRRRGGETRPMAALKVSDGAWKGGWIGLAGQRLQIKERGAAALVQKFASPAHGRTNYIEITYSPPGGSYLPTPIFLAPFKP
jgi:hypothetical protein